MGESVSCAESDCSCQFHNNHTDEGKQMTRNVFDNHILVNTSSLVCCETFISRTYTCLKLIRYKVLPTRPILPSKLILLRQGKSNNKVDACHLFSCLSVFVFATLLLSSSLHIPLPIIIVHYRPSNNYFFRIAFTISIVNITNILLSYCIQLDLHNLEICISNHNG